MVGGGIHSATHFVTHLHLYRRVLDIEAHLKRAAVRMMNRRAARRAPGCSGSRLQDHSKWVVISENKGLKEGRTQEKNKIDSKESFKYLIAFCVNLLGKKLIAIVFLFVFFGINVIII